MDFTDRTIAVSTTVAVTKTMMSVMTVAVHHTAAGSHLGSKSASAMAHLPPGTAAIRTAAVLPESGSAVRMPPHPSAPPAGIMVREAPVAAPHAMPVVMMPGHRQLPGPTVGTRRVSAAVMTAAMTVGMTLSLTVATCGLSRLAVTVTGPPDVRTVPTFSAGRAARSARCSRPAAETGSDRADRSAQLGYQTESDEPGQRTAHLGGKLVEFGLFDRPRFLALRDRDLRRLISRLGDRNLHVVGNLSQLFASLDHDRPRHAE
jgi:hypothetical protein